VVIERHALERLGFVSDALEHDVASDAPPEHNVRSNDDTFAVSNTTSPLHDLARE
jgi:hypothetical protein